MNMLDTLRASIGRGDVLMDAAIQLFIDVKCMPGGVKEEADSYLFEHAMRAARDGQIPRSDQELRHFKAKVLIGYRHQERDFYCSVQFDDEIEAGDYHYSPAEEADDAEGEPPDFARLERLAAHCTTLGQRRAVEFVRRCGAEGFGNRRFRARVRRAVCNEFGICDRTARRYFSALADLQLSVDWDEALVENAARDAAGQILTEPAPLLPAAAAAPVVEMVVDLHHRPLRVELHRSRCGFDRAQARGRPGRRAAAHAHAQSRICENRVELLHDPSPPPSPPLPPPLPRRESWHRGRGAS